MVLSDTWTRVGALGSVIALIALVYKVLRDRRGEQKAKNEEQAKGDAATWSTIQPLYEDLGTLYHKALSFKDDEVIEQLGVISEKQRRGVYDLRQAPHSLQAFWTAISYFFEQYRMNAHQPYFQDSNVKSFMTREIGSLAQHMHNVLKGLKPEQHKTRAL